MISLMSEGNLIDWPAIRMILKPGIQIDVQLNEIEPPLPYVVLMSLDIPIFFCRLVEGVEPPEFEIAESQMVFVPGIRDFCSLKVVIKDHAERGKYLALAPMANAEFLRRRRSIRVKTWEDISYRVQFEGKSNIYKGVAVEDIGRGGIGLLVYAAGPVQEGVEAKIRVNLPGVREQVLAGGIVSHCIAQENLPRMYRIGIRFTKISPRDQQTIAVYIDQARKVENTKQRV